MRLATTGGREERLDLLKTILTVSKGCEDSRIRREGGKEEEKKGRKGRRKKEKQRGREEEVGGRE